MMRKCFHMLSKVEKYVNFREGNKFTSVSAKNNFKIKSYYAHMLSFMHCVESEPDVQCKMLVLKQKQLSSSGGDVLENNL